MHTHVTKPQAKLAPSLPSYSNPILALNRTLTLLLSLTLALLLPTQALPLRPSLGRFLMTESKLFLNEEGELFQDVLQELEIINCNRGQARPPTPSTNAAPLDSTRAAVCVHTR